jgi:hypothetical protein
MESVMRTFPCEYGCFAVLKRLYGRQIKGYMRNRVNHIDKQDFLTVYLAAHTETMSLANIQSSFAATGLVPYDPKRVLSKLHTQLKTPTPPSSSHTTKQGPWGLETLRNAAQLEL